MTANGSSVRALRIPPEPVTLREELRLAIGENPDSASTRIVETLADNLHQSWQNELDDDRLSEKLHDIVADDEREAWLWVMGNRTWEQFIDGLSGRIVRRAKGSSS